MENVNQNVLSDETKKCQENKCKKSDQKIASLVIAIIALCIASISLILNFIFGGMLISVAHQGTNKPRYEIDCNCRDNRRFALQNFDTNDNATAPKREKQIYNETENNNSEYFNSENFGGYNEDFSNANKSKNDNSNKQSNNQNRKTSNVNNALTIGEWR